MSVLQTNTNQRILLIGTQGQVGWELLRCAQPLGTVFSVDKVSDLFTTDDIDLANPDSIRTVVKKIKPTVILNAAAYTAVDKAEQDIELAHKINGIAPGILAELAKSLGAWLIHYSTDYVYDGQKQQPYQEDDPVNPMSVYGTTKLAGDQAIQSVGGQYLILRTAWVYGRRGQNFLLTMQRLAKEREELRVVNDQRGTPTWSKLIAETTVQILSQLQSPLLKINPEKVTGVYHLTCSGQTTWYDFTKAIVSHLNLDKPPRLVPITTAEYPTAAKRPAYSVLANTKLANTFGVTLPAWDKALELCLTTHL